jgi:hypothetical protein
MAEAFTSVRGRVVNCARALANVLVAEKLTTTQAIQPLLARLQTERRAAALK